MNNDDDPGLSVSAINHQQQLHHSITPITTAKYGSSFDKNGKYVWPQSYLDGAVSEQSLFLWSNILLSQCKEELFPNNLIFFDEYWFIL